MAIELQTIPVSGVTPLPNNSASAVAFANDYFKLAVPNFSTQDRKALIALAMVRLLADVGVNYRANHARAIQDAAVFTKGISNIDIFAGMAAIVWSSARGSDVGLTGDVEALLREARDFVDLPEDTLDRIILYLFAQIGP